MAIRSSFDLAQHYYRLKPYLPRKMQIFLRRCRALMLRELNRNVWPIDCRAGATPEGWQGWPGGKLLALVLTHDVESSRGVDRCLQVMEIERSMGLRSSFNFVVGDYDVPSDLREEIVRNGFEVGIHGLVHDRSLYDSLESFRDQAARINRCMEEWQSVGFRSPCMYHNLEWMHELRIDYDASTFDTDPFEPQPDGTGTIFPFYVAGGDGRRGYVELPYTLPQDFTLFIIFREKNIDTWKKKLHWIAEHGGMALVNSHPDYMNFNGRDEYEEYPVRYYREFLEHVTSAYAGDFWNPLPQEMAVFLREKKEAQERGLFGEAFGPAQTAALILSVSFLVSRGMKWLDIFGEL